MILITHNQPVLLVRAGLDPVRDGIVPVHVLGRVRAVPRRGVRPELGTLIKQVRFLCYVQTQPLTSVESRKLLQNSLEVADGAAAGRGAARAGVGRRQRTEVGHLLGR